MKKRDHDAKERYEGNIGVRWWLSDPEWSGSRMKAIMYLLGVESMYCWKWGNNPQRIESNWSVVCFRLKLSGYWNLKTQSCPGKITEPRQHPFISRPIIVLVFTVRATEWFSRQVLIWRTTWRDRGASEGRYRISITSNVEYYLRGWTFMLNSSSIHLPIAESSSVHPPYINMVL